MTNYNDIINMPHHRSKRHKHISVNERAAQFAPFAALNGYDEAIEEAAHLTDISSLSDDSTRFHTLGRKITTHRY